MALRLTLRRCFPATNPARDLLAACLLAAAAAPGCGEATGPYYVAPDGDNSNPGTLERPWRTLRRATSALKPGDTLYLRGGRYDENQVRIAVAGSASAPITIRNHPGETPVIDGSLAEFRTAPNQAWEVFNASTGVWRSVAKFPKAREVHGTFGARNGSFRLVPYEDYGPLGATNEDYDETWPTYYIGPGVFWNEDDQRIYVRLERCRGHLEAGFANPLQQRDPQVHVGAADVQDPGRSAHEPPTTSRTASMTYSRSSSSRPECNGRESMRW